jgi:hypothetical protein
VRSVFYNSDLLDAAIQKQISDMVLFVSASRTRLKDDEVALAQVLAGSSKHFIHIALWNPYSIQNIPQPASVSFGFQEAALNQGVHLLMDAVSEAKLPFELGEVT